MRHHPCLRGFSNVVLETRLRGRNYAVVKTDKKVSVLKSVLGYCGIQG